MHCLIAMMKQILYLIPPVWATTVVTLTSIEAKPAAQLVFLGLFAIICGLYGMLRKKAWRRYPVAGLVDQCHVCRFGNCLHDRQYFLRPFVLFMNTEDARCRKFAGR